MVIFHFKINFNLFSQSVSSFYFWCMPSLETSAVVHMYIYIYTHMYCLLIIHDRAIVSTSKHIYIQILVNK